MQNAFYLNPENIFAVGLFQSLDWTIALFLRKSLNCGGNWNWSDTVVRSEIYLSD